MTKAIPSFKYVEYCPVDHLKNWMIENKNELVFPISDKNVALIIKKHALSAGLDEKNMLVTVLDQVLLQQQLNMEPMKETSWL